VGLGVKPPPQVHDPGGGVRSIALKYLSLGVPRHPVPRFWTPLAAPRRVRCTRWAAATYRLAYASQREISP
jgi:hypothetical protein